MTTTSGSAIERVRQGVRGALVVLLIAGASVVGLHDWADAQTTATSQHY